MKRLKRWLEDTDITQAAFAESIGVSQVSISQWVNGVHEPPIDKIREISRKTGLSLDELLDNKPKKPRERRAHV